MREVAGLLLKELNLHSTVVLLKGCLRCWFRQNSPHLHSTVVLLKVRELLENEGLEVDLHSTVVLLKVYLIGIKNGVHP